MTTATPLWRRIQILRGEAPTRRATSGMPEIPVENKWTPDRTLAFLLAVCGAFWLVVGVLFLLFRHYA
jgi:hypothetical protein